MSSKTKIIVLHMKEVVYTTVFLALAILLLVVFLIMFGSGKKGVCEETCGLIHRFCRECTLHSRHLYLHNFSR